MAKADNVMMMIMMTMLMAVMMMLMMMRSPDVKGWGTSFGERRTMTMTIMMMMMTDMIMMMTDMIMLMRMRSPDVKGWGTSSGGELRDSEGKVCKRGNNTYNYRIIILNKGPQYLHDI